MSDCDTSRDQVSTESAHGFDANPDLKDLYLKHNAIWQEQDVYLEHDTNWLYLKHNATPLSAGANQTQNHANDNSLRTAFNKAAAFIHAGLRQQADEQLFSKGAAKSQPEDLATIIRDCALDFSQSASDQALWEKLSAVVEDGINEARAESGLPSLREAERQKRETPPAPPELRSNDDIMEAVRLAGRGWTS